MAKLLRVDGMVKFFNLNKEHTKNILVEIPENSEEQSTGLMNREEINENQGMLFIYDEPQHLSMWMKNVKFSIDIIFVNNRKIIENVIKNAEPLSSTLYNSKGPCKYAVEVIAGFTDTYRVEKGQQIEIKRNLGSLEGE